MAAVPAQSDALSQADLLAKWRNIRLMHQLERIAAAFEAAGVPLMLLKGAALHLTLYERPEQRPMTDVDLLVRLEDASAAQEVLAGLGATPGPPLVRKNFFPDYYYETEWNLGAGSAAVRIDLHARPLRPLRYARTIPPGAIWDRATPVRLGSASVWVPSVEDMALHLAAHAAVHGFSRPQWLTELNAWLVAHDDVFDWQLLLQRATDWRLTEPLRLALHRVIDEHGLRLPRTFARGLARARPSWADRLAVWHAPRDATHSATHVLVNVLTTPGWRFKLGYLLAVALPDRPHMSGWYGRRHRGWFWCAQAVRWLRPTVAWAPALWRRWRSGSEQGQLTQRLAVAAVDGP